MRLMKKLICAIVISLSFAGFAQVADRDVVYTKALYKLIEGYFNNSFETREEAEKTYAEAVESVKEFAADDEYRRQTHLSRCDYYFGMYVMATYDLTRLEHALDDTSKEFEDPVEKNKRIRAEACKWFEQAVEISKKAMEVKQGADAMSIYAQAVSACCTVKTVAYVLGNGLKIGQYAKKAVKIDPLNGTAWFSVNAQDVYAPGIFGNANRGRKTMLQYLNDETLIKEKFDYFNFTCAVAYTYFRQHNYKDAIVWYRKCQDIFPNNYAIFDLVAKCEANIAAQEK